MFGCSVIQYYVSNFADSRIEAGDREDKISFKSYFMRSFFFFSVYSAAVKC